MANPSKQQVLVFYEKFAGDPSLYEKLDDFVVRLFLATDLLSAVDANLLCRFVLETGIVSMRDYLGHDAPPESDLGLMRDAMKRLELAMMDDEGPIRGDQLMRVRRLLATSSQSTMSERISKGTVSMSDPGFAQKQLSLSGVHKLPSMADPVTGGITPSRPHNPHIDPATGQRTDRSLDSRRKLDMGDLRDPVSGLRDPVTSGSRSSNERLSRQSLSRVSQATAPTPEELSGEFLPPSHKYNEWMVLSAALTLAATVFAILTIVSYPESQEMRLVVSGGFASLLLLYYGIKQEQPLLLVAMAIIAFGGGGYRLYKHFNVIRETARIETGSFAARDRMQRLSLAIEGYRRQNGKTPMGLGDLTTPVSYLSPGERDPQLLFRDPFSPERRAFYYARSTESFILQSVGPAGLLSDVSANPLDHLIRPMEDDLASKSYDPTNGLSSPGGLFHSREGFVGFAKE